MSSKWRLEFGAKVPMRTSLSLGVRVTEAALRAGTPAQKRVTAARRLARRLRVMGSSFSTSEGTPFVMRVHSIVHFKYQLLERPSEDDPCVRWAFAHAHCERQGKLGS